MDILAPLDNAGLRNCVCGQVDMRVVPVKEIGHNNLVEVKIFRLYNTKNTKGNGKELNLVSRRKRITQELKDYNKFAQVIKMHDHYLSGECGLHQLTQYDIDHDTLFYRNKSKIVITDLDTPGIKVVKEWSNPDLETSDEYIAWLKKRIEKLNPNEPSTIALNTR